MFILDFGIVLLSIIFSAVGIGFIIFFYKKD